MVSLIPIIDLPNIMMGMMDPLLHSAQLVQFKS